MGIFAADENKCQRWEPRREIGMIGSELRDKYKLLRAFPQTSGLSAADNTCALLPAVTSIRGNRAGGDDQKERVKIAIARLQSSASRPTDRPCRKRAPSVLESQRTALADPFPQRSTTRLLSTEIKRNLIALHCCCFLHNGHLVQHFKRAHSIRLALRCVFDQLVCPLMNHARSCGHGLV